MKIILERDGVKREIEGPFAVCASRADLRTLQEQIGRVLANWDEREVSRGWAVVYPQPEQRTSTPPRKWTDA